MSGANHKQSQGIRGLSIFIGDIRACQNKDQEIKTVHKEMAKIRQKFQNKGLSGYDKKKYVWKLIYAHILGYEVEFGHEEALNLINAQKFTEKSSGYIAIGIMLNEQSNYQLFERVINAVKTDLRCGNEVCEGLALATLGNIGFAEMVPHLKDIVIEKAFSPNINSYVQKRAIMCLLSFFRRDRSIYDIDQWLKGFKFLLGQKHKGILLSTCALIQGVVQIMGREGLHDIVPYLTSILQNIASYADDYYYYKTPCPWLQVKVLKLLQFFPPPPNKKDLNLINEIMMQLINKTEVTKNVNKNNSDHSILFEVFNLIIHYGDASFEILREDTIKLLGKYVDVREPNIRYLALETMSRMSNIDKRSRLIKKFIHIFFKNLRDNDISIRRIALNSLFSLCDNNTSGEIVNEILDYLQENDYELKEEMVLKVAILAEKFAENLNWYIDVIIKLIEYAGDYVNEDLWFRVAQIITGFGEADANIQLQKYAALKLFDVMKTASLHETMVKICSYVLSEFGHLIVDHDGKSFKHQFSIILKHFYNVSNVTKAIMMTSFMKMVRNSPELQTPVMNILNNYKNHWDEELQQRACEYVYMLNQSKEDQTVCALVTNALEKMPNFSEELQTNNVLTRRILSLQVKKGFAINVEEAEANMKQNMQKYSTQVSSALNSNQKSSFESSLAGLNLDGNSSNQLYGDKFATNMTAPQQLAIQSAPEQNSVDLLGDMGAVVPVPQQPDSYAPASQDTISALQDILGGGISDSQPSQPSLPQNDLMGLNMDPQPVASSQPAAASSDLFGQLGEQFGSMGMNNDQVNHEFAQKHPESFAPKQTVQLIDQTLNMDDQVPNAQYWKKLLPTGLTQGVIYEDESCQITTNVQQIKYLHREMLTFTGKNGTHPSNINAVISNYSGDDNLQIQCSPVKYNPDGSPPQIIIMAMLKQPYDLSPELGIYLEIQGGYTLNTQIRLPILTNTFIEKVPMAQEAFAKNWNNITQNQPDTFQKIDKIVKNPAPPAIPIDRVQQQIESFFTNALNMTCYTNGDLIQACGQITTCPLEQNGFPSNPNEMAKPENIPLMIEAQFYPDIQTNEFRLSLRSTNNKQCASQVINFIKFFMNV